MIKYGHKDMGTNVIAYCNQGPRYKFLHEGAIGKPGDEQSETKTLKGSELLPWKNSRPLSADLVQTTLIFVPQYRQTLQVNIHWDVKKTKKFLWFDIGLRQVC